MLSQNNKNVNTNSIKSLLQWAFLQLKSASKSPFLDAEVLLSNVIKKEKKFLYSRPEKNLTASQIKKFKLIISRRKKYEPVAYIIGYKYFYGLKFKVNAHTLIPRPETEMIIEEALNILQKQKYPLLIDIGAGSGCIPIAVAKNIKKSVKIFATDISMQALNVAKKNSRINKVEKKIKFFKGNLFMPFIKMLRNTPHQHIIIAANLPYLPSPVYNRAIPDVKLYEPKSALDGGKDGLKYYRELFQQIKKIQSQISDFHILCETDPSQKNSITNLAKKYFPCSKIQIKKDLSGLDRLLIIKKEDNG